MAWSSFRWGLEYPLLLTRRGDTCMLLLISMLWHRQAIFESKGDKLSSSAECRITQGLRHLFANRLNACWQTDCAIEDQAKTWTRKPVLMISKHSKYPLPYPPYDQQAFSPLDLTVNWLSHLALAIYTFVVVNFDALAQASDIRIERRQVVFLCWMQDSNPRSQTPIRQQTECLLTNRLSYRRPSLKLELDSPSLWSASIRSILIYRLGLEIHVFQWDVISHPYSNTSGQFKSPLMSNHVPHGPLINVLIPVKLC